MRFDEDLFHSILNEVGQKNHQAINEQLLESGIYAHLPIQPDLLRNAGITCDFGDQRCAKLNKKLQTKFPEHIIGGKVVGNGKKVVVITSRNTLNVHSSLNFELIDSIQCDYHATSICCLILGDNVENLRVLFGSVMGDLIEWKLNEGTVPIGRKGHKGMIFAIANDSERLFTISDDRTIRMWDLEDENGDKEPICSVFGHMARPFAILVDETEHTIYTGGIEQTLFTWKYDAKGIKLSAKTFLSSGVIRKITKIDQNTVCVGSYEGNLIMVNIQQKSESIEVEDGLINFAHLQDSLVTLDEKNTLTVHSSDEMDEIVCRAENVRHMNSSDDSIVAWDDSILYFVKKSKIHRIEMSSSIISAITRNDYLIVKLIDGFLRIYDLSDENIIKFVKKFSLPKSSMIPSVFAVLEIRGNAILIVGTTHGELYQCIISKPDSNVKEAIDKRLSKELFLGKEVTCIEPIEDSNCFMALSKTGSWSTFRIDIENDDNPIQPKITILNSRSFAASHRMTWPCQFLKTFSDSYIIGFHGTNLVVWDMDKGIPVYELYCGGGHRIWHIMESIESSEVLIFDFIRNGKLCRQNIQLNNIRHIAHSAHSSPIVCASGSLNYLATASLDGVMSITSKYKSDSFDYNLEFTMFAGENLLCCDILEDSEKNELFIVTGGGKSKMSIWKFEEGCLKNNTFWLRSISRPDEGRIVSVKIVNYESLTVFVASFSSGVIELFKIDDENNGIESILRIELDDEMGIGSKIAAFVIGQEKMIRLFIGTSGSYMMTFNIQNLETIKLDKKIKLKDRSGVTSICIIDDEKCIVGCDSGHVYVVGRDETVDHIQSHLSTVVGIVQTEEVTHSVSLDAMVLSTENRQTRRKPTVVHMPGAMTTIGNSIIVVGDGIQRICV